MDTKNTKTPVESLRKGLELLERLVRFVGRGARPSELADETGLKLTTAHNLLKTLELCGWVRKEGRGQYVGGWRLASLVRPARLDLNPDGVAAQAVREAGRLTGDAVVLATLVGGRRAVVARAEGEGPVRVVGEAEAAGASIWNWVTGRVLAAFCSEEERRAIVEREGLPGAAWEGIGSQRRLGEALERIARQGYAESCGGEVASLAAPVLGDSGGLVGALGMFLPRYRYTGERRGEILAVIRKQAGWLSKMAEEGGQ